MIAVILAAGRGSRLSKSNLPKPLTPLSNGESLLGRQVRLLKEHFQPEKIHIVVGYEQEQFRAAFPECTFVYSKHYATQNTAKSLLLALEGIDEDLLWLNGDVVFHPEVLQALVGATRNVMVVNQNRAVEEEEVKYQTKEANTITQVSKTVEEAEGEAIGMNRFCQNDLSVLKKELQKCGENDYFEKAIEGAIGKGVVVKPLIIPTDHATEVDFPADLDHANALLSRW